MKNIESDVPADFNAMLRRILDKYPYLNGWYSSKGSAAVILGDGDKLDLDRFIEWISISENENPFGHYVMKIIDCNSLVDKMLIEETDENTIIAKIEELMPKIKKKTEEFSMNDINKDFV